MHDGKDPHWFHFKCFFEKHRPKTTDDIDHFEDIRYEDQEKIRQKVVEFSGILLPEASKGKKGKKRAAEAEAPASNVALMDFGIEYSVSSRAECVGCQNKIVKDDIRIKKIVYDTEVGEWQRQLILLKVFKLFYNFRHEVRRTTFVASSQLLREDPRRLRLLLGRTRLARIRDFVAGRQKDRQEGIAVS